MQNEDIKKSEVFVMNSRAGAIISAHTGVLCCEFSSFHKYIEEIMGGPIFTHQLADRALTDEIKDKSKDDFIKLIESQYAVPVKDDQIRFLWSLLDDISTAGDMFKPEINGYFKYINSICEKRTEVAKSLDGYSLTINNHSPMESRIKALEFSLDDRNCYIADADMKNEALTQQVTELRAALLSIKSRQQVLTRSGFEFSSVWQIADKALRE